MKFTCSIEIHRSVDNVVRLQQDPHHLKDWQDGFVSIAHLSGEPRTEGAKSQLVYQIGSKTINLIETIEIMDLPREFRGRYECDATLNTMTNRFFSQAPGLTRWDAEVEYLEFRGFMPKLMAFLLPGLFKNQTQKWLDQFKVFAESDGDG